MSTRELYIGGGSTSLQNPGFAMFPGPAFSATDPNNIAAKPADQKGPNSFALERVLDFQFDSSLKQYVNAQIAAGTPIVAADHLGVQLIPRNTLFLGIHVTIENPQPGVILTPTTRNGALTFPAIDCSAAQPGLFGAPGATTWVTGGPGAEVQSITLTAPGSGYTTAPAVALTGGAGTGATAVANLVGAGVSGISVAAGGSGYATAPTVTITGTGTGATATATVAAGAITAFTVTNAGTGYTAPPTVSLSGGGGTGGAGTAAVTASAVASVTVTNVGTGYTSAPTVAFSGGGGTAAAGTAVLSTSSQAGLSNATFNNTVDILDLVVTAVGAKGFGNLRVTVTPAVIDFKHGQH